MKPTHTPGEWQAVLDPYLANRWLVEKRERGWKTLIAEVYGDEDHQQADFEGTREGNARLIAAAPCLLALIQEINCWLTSPDLSKGVVEAYKHDCEIAIARATAMPPRECKPT